MYRLRILFCAMLICTELALYAQNTTTGNAVPETEKPYEFPQWAKDMRRFDIIAFGVVPFAWFVTTIVVDLQRSAAHGWSDGRYYPWPATGQNPVAWNNDDYANAMIITGVTALSFALIDYVIIRIKRSKAEARTRELTGDAPTIRRTPPDVQGQTPEDAQGPPAESQKAGGP